MSLLSMLLQGRHEGEEEDDGNGDGGDDDHVGDDHVGDDGGGCPAVWSSSRPSWCTCSLKSLWMLGMLGMLGILGI